MNKEQLVQMLQDEASSIDMANIGDRNGFDDGIVVGFDRAAETIGKALEGYAIVPVEPSAEMITAGMNGRIYCKSRSVVAETCEAYKAMLTAWEQGDNSNE